MTLPDVHFEVFYDEQWNEHIQDIAFEESDLKVEYGRTDEHGDAEPTKIEGTLDNRDNDWSPKDPRSSGWGKIGQGTKCRVRVGDPNPTDGVLLPGVRYARISTPDVSALDITGDIDIRLEITAETWRPELLYVLMAKYWSGGSERSWIFYLSTTGFLQFRWTTDGSTGTIQNAASTAAIPDSSTRLAVRVTLDVNNGASGRTATFYTAPSISGSWTQLGSAVTSPGTTSIFATSRDVAIGSDSVGEAGFVNAGFGAMTVHAAEIRNSIGGTAVANPDFTGLTSTDTELTDAAGRVWTLQPGAGVVDTSIRGTAAIPDFDPQWDETGYAAMMSFRAAGILEQLGRPGEPPRSAMFRSLYTRTNLVGYWPLEDAAGATQFVGGRPGIPPAQPFGNYSAGNGSDFTAAAAQVGLNDPSTGATGIVGVVPPYTPTARQRAFCLVSVPDGGVSAEAQLLNYACSGTVKRISVNINTSGQLALIMRDAAGNSLLDSGFSSFGMNGTPKVVSVLVTQDGSDIDWQLGVFSEADTAVSFIDGTVSSQTYGRFTSPQCGPSPSLNGTGFVHLTIVNDDRDGDIWDIMGDALHAWAGEHALEREARLCIENSQPLMLIGQGLASEAMGVQTITEFLNLVGQCGESDLGPFGERRDAYALLGRGRSDLYNQTPALTLNMRNGEVANPFEAPYDTQSAQNDVTVSREGGSSYRVVKTSGAQSTADPPEGLGGSFPASPQLSLAADEQLPNQATWRLWLGTTDQHRVPRLELEMEHHPELVDAVLALRMGDIILIENAGDLNGLPPGDLRLMFLGSADAITDDTWHVVLNCAPGEPWTIGTISDGSDDERFDTDGSIVASTNFTAGVSTSLRVTTLLGPLWTVADPAFPLDINADGAILTVTDVTGSTNTQTFTVSTTVVNGVERLIPAGSDVRLANPTIVGL